MGYTLKDDEIAIVIAPVNDDDGTWQGGVSINVAINKGNGIETEVMAHLLNLATMMSCFMDIIEEYEDIYELVEDKRNEIMGIMQEEAKPKVTKEGNVYTLNAWTKTEGNA